MTLAKRVVKEEKEHFMNSNEVIVVSNSNTEMPGEKLDIIRTGWTQYDFNRDI